MLTVTIDWIAATFKEYTNEAEQFIVAYASFGTPQASKPRNGYNTALRDDCGSELLWNTGNRGMGYHVVFSGSALRNLFEQKAIQPLTLLRALYDAGGRVSRLDLAKDCTGEKIDGAAVYKSLEQGRGGGNTRTFGRIVSNGGGDTIYIGSRQSERFIRVYNKAAQTGDTTIDWWRMEIETKGDVARLVALSLYQGAGFVQLFDGIINKMVGELDSVGLEPFVSRGLVEFGLPKVNKVTDREKWIAEQVIQAIAQHYIDNPNSEAIAALKQMLEKIDKQRKL